jgi:ABC-type transporter Mla maintaining outer membrane lipid asymmetry ATPase subunit MlaF
MMAQILELKEVSNRLGNKDVVREVNLSVPLLKYSVF